MVDLRILLHLRKDSSSVIFQFLSSINPASNRSSHIDFLFHTISSWYLSILRHIPPRMFMLSPTMVIFVKACTVGTYLNFRAISTRRVFSNIVLASFFYKTFIIPKLVNSKRVPSMTSASSCTVKDGLYWECHLREFIPAHDINSVSQSWGCCMCPTGTTVLRDMLISRKGE